MERLGLATWSREKNESGPGAPSDPQGDVSDSVLLPCLCAGKTRVAKLGCSPSPAVTQGQQALFSGEGARWAHIVGAQSLKQTAFTLSGFSFCSCPSQTEETEKPKCSRW